MSMQIINVSKDFTRYPSGRLRRNGTTSGEEFRERFLEPAVKAGKKIQLELDGTIGYGSSFLEEAFGGLVRSLGMRSNAFLELIEFVTENSALETEIRKYVEDAVRVQNSAKNG